MKYLYLFFFILLFALNSFVSKAKNNFAGDQMKIKKYEDRIQIDFFSKEKNMQIVFNSCGVNRLLAIAQVNYYSNLTNHINKKASNEFPSCTDWIGPYFVCLNANSQKEITKKFTGGWHGSNGDGTGDPTAYTTNATIKVDGKIQRGNFDLDCLEADIIVTNLIQGYDYQDTKKYLLKEVVRYTIKPNQQIDVNLTIMALEDVIISRYYGLQSQNFAIFDSVSYASNLKNCNVAITNTNSQCKSNINLNTIVLSDSQSGLRIKVWLNEYEGLGKFEYLGKNKPKAFSAKYGKSYFNLINGKELHLKKGGEVFWKGSYFWE
jgi:hypothetical protein